MNARPTIVRWDELPLERVSELVSKKVVVGRELALTQVYFKKGALVPVHRRATEQVVYLLQGAMRFTIGAASSTVREGESIVIPAGCDRQVESLDDSFMLVEDRREQTGTSG
jgi:quercetin dioxygenase-like cupin family protein